MLGVHQKEKFEVGCAEINECSIIIIAWLSIGGKVDFLCDAVIEIFQRKIK